MNKLLLLLVSAIILFNVQTYAQNNIEKEKQITERVDSLLALMTLEEKAGQLNQLSFGIGFGPNVKSTVPDEYKNLIREGKIGSFLNALGAEFTGDLQKIAVTESRLKIPLIFGYDVIHGFKTTFPVPIGQAATWQPEMVEMSTHYQALEASSAGVHWTFSPMVDIARDPRWGRIMEGSGEDPYLGSLMAAASVRGYQGNLSENNIIACAKHYAGYGGAEGGRDYNTVDISERTFQDVYLPPFKSAVEAGVETIMASFNEIGGVPSSASKYLLTDILRDQWKFKGFVVSDWNSIGELINHGVAEDLKQAGELAVNAGLDMDMESRAYVTYLANLVKEGKVSEETVNESVKRVLRVKFLLGLFDDPFKYCNKEREKKTILSKEIKDAALEVSKRSFVLLKNEGNLLPIKKYYKKIALIGPLANSTSEPTGGWEAMGDSSDVVSILKGIKNYLQGNIDVLYSEGCKISDQSTEGFKEAINTAKNSDLVILCLGEGKGMSGEASCRSTLDLPGVQQQLAEEIFKTGKPIIVVLMNGRPLSITWINENIPGILETWFPGITAGDAIARVLFGEYNPAGKLPITFPRTVGQVPIYYNHKNTGRPGDLKNHYTSKYLDLPLSPLYPFGYGLSYTTFNYSDLSLDKNKITKNDELKIKVNVKNTGNYDGEEVVQIYVQDLVGSITRPVKELKRFQKIFLKKGEEKTVEFTISEKDLRFTAADMKFKSEPGLFNIYVGTNSVDCLEANFELLE